MAKYTFKQDSVQKYRVYDSNIGTSSSVDQSITFKKGDVVDGVFTPSHTIGGGNGIIAETTLPDTILVPNPNINKGLFNGNGATSWFSISPDILELSSDHISDSNQNTGLVSQTFIQKQKNHLLIAGALVLGYLAYKKFNK